MRVVISGSGGLIGRALVAALRVAGDDVTRLVRRPAGAGEASWDPDLGDLDPTVLDGADAVVHLAGAGIGDKRWSARRRQEIVSSRVRSTALLADTVAGLAAPASP